MKRTAILLYDNFSSYELSVAVSVLCQGGREYDLFSKEDTTTGEEGLRVRRSKTMESCNPGDYDSLLLPGCMDVGPHVDNASILLFLRGFSLERQVIAAISSAPVLLLKAGLLGGKTFLAGVPREGLLAEGFLPNQLAGMYDHTRLPLVDGKPAKVLRDGNLLTALGSGFVEFGVAFGKMLGLDFDPAWYGW